MTLTLEDRDLLTLELALDALHRANGMSLPVRRLETKLFQLFKIDPKEARIKRQQVEPSPWGRKDFLDCLERAKQHIIDNEPEKALVQIRIAELHC